MNPTLNELLVAARREELRLAMARRRPTRDVLDQRLARSGVRRRRFGVRGWRLDRSRLASSRAPRAN
jgi:hypothetical protein